MRVESADRIPGDSSRRTHCHAGLDCYGNASVNVLAHQRRDHLSSGLGSTSTLSHPVLSTLLHYNVFLSKPATGFEADMRHGQAICHEQGKWANTVFGRFRNRSFRPEFLMLHETSIRKLWILQECSAALFMVFAEVDCYMTVSPYVTRLWRVYLAEGIVKANHLNIYSRGRPVDSFTPVYCQAIELFTKTHSCSSP